MATWEEKPRGHVPLDPHNHNKNICPDCGQPAWVNGWPFCEDGHDMYKGRMEFIKRSVTYTPPERRPDRFEALNMPKKHVGWLAEIGYEAEVRIYGFSGLLLDKGGK